MIRFIITALFVILFLIHIRHLPVFLRFTHYANYRSVFSVQIWTSPLLILFLWQIRFFTFHACLLQLPLQLLQLLRCYPAEVSGI